LADLLHRPPVTRADDNLVVAADYGDVDRRLALLKQVCPFLVAEAADRGQSNFEGLNLSGGHVVELLAVGSLLLICCASTESSLPEAAETSTKPAAQPTTETSESSSPARIETPEGSDIAGLLATVKRTKPEGSSIDKVKAVEALRKINQIGEVGIGTVELHSVAEHLRDWNRIRIKHREDLRLFLAKASEVAFILIGRCDHVETRRTVECRQNLCLRDSYKTDLNCC